VGILLTTARVPTQPLTFEMVEADAE
jgi:hypothetical protein